MQLTKTLVTAVLAAVSSVQAISIAYHEQWNEGFETSVGSCSDGPMGLAANFPKYGDFPNWPFVAGGFPVAGWGSPKCGSCWQITYQGKSIYVTVADHSAGFDLTKAAFENLAGSLDMGRFEADAVEVGREMCGFPA